jgi:excisionase family DNA binding protein
MNASIAINTAMDGVERILLRIPEVEQATGYSRSLIHEQIASGSLKSIRLGRTIRIAVDDLREWFESLRQVELSTLNDAELMGRYHKLPALRVSLKKYEAEVMAEIKTRWETFVDTQDSIKEKKKEVV